MLPEPIFMFFTAPSMNAPVAQFPTVSTLVLAGVSFILSFLLTPLFRDFAIRRGLLDKPDSKRKLHTARVPRIGGAAIVLAYAGSFAILMLIGLRASLGVELPFPILWKLL